MGLDYYKSILLRWVESQNRENMVYFSATKNLSTPGGAGIFQFVLPAAGCGTVWSKSFCSLVVQ